MRGQIAKPFLILPRRLWTLAREVYGDTVDLYEPQEIPAMTNVFPVSRAKQREPIEAIKNAEARRRALAVRNFWKPAKLDAADADAEKDAEDAARKQDAADGFGD